MKEIIRRVSLRALYDILRSKGGKPEVTWPDFIFQISTAFLNLPSLEFRFHDIDERLGIDKIYILSHKDIAEVIREKAQPKPEDRL